MRIRLLLLLSVISVPALLHAQTAGSDPLYLGIEGGYNLRWQEASIGPCPEAECSPFVDGSGTGIAIGVSAFVPLTEDLDLRAALRWESVDGEFTSLRKNYPFLGQNNQVEYVDLEDELDISMSVIQLDLRAAYTVMQPGIFVSAGPVLSLPLSSNWKLSETITSPDRVSYLDGERSLVLWDEEIPDMNVHFGLRAGAGARLTVMESLILVPEITYTHPLTELHSDFAWTMSGVDVSVALMMKL